MHAIATSTDRPDRHAISNSLTVKVDAAPHATRHSLSRIDVTSSALRALDELGFSHLVIRRPSGISWKHEERRGEIRADVDVTVRPAEQDSSWLTISIRFSGSDEDARIRLLDTWALIGPIASNLAERAARAVKAHAERDDFDDVEPALGVRAA